MSLEKNTDAVAFLPPNAGASLIVVDEDHAGGFQYVVIASCLEGCDPLWLFDSTCIFF